MEIRDRYHDHIPVYTDGSRDGNYVACATVFPSNTVISMILLDLASIFTAEIWAIIKALEEKQISCFYRLTFVSPRFTVYEPRTSLECVFLNVAKKHIICVGYPAIFALGVMKGLPGLLWICLMPR